MPYFVDNLKNIKIYNSSEDGLELRSPQVGAYQAVCAHFTCSDEIASVVIPTGVGKTATMALLPFGLKANRVLIIAPSRTVRGQIAEEFKHLELFAKFNVFTNENKPKVFENTKSIGEDDAWVDLLQYDVVVSTPHCISSKYEHVSAPNTELQENLFDLVIIDEAHHIPAKTWMHILNQFKNAKQVLFTATPFRRDSKKLPGVQVYAYPLTKAIDNGYYENISYIPLELNPSENKDLALAQKAKEQFDLMRQQNPRIKILVKVNSKAKTKRIKDIYNGLGLNVDIVSSDNAYTTNKKAIEELKTNSDLHGLVCVDMLGEGFDLPEIKIAVLHTLPQSFLPFVQFVGRIARKINGDRVAGVLIADKNDFSNEITRVTDDYTQLSKLIPNIVDNLVQERREKRIYYDEFETEFLGFDEPINLENIYPSFTIKLYSINNEYFSYDAEIKLTGSIKLEEYQTKDNLAIFITSREIKPKWTKSNLLKSKEYHLNVFYFDREKNILIHHSTDDNVGNCLLESLCIDPSKRKQIKMNYIFQLMQKASNAEYINIGVKNPLSLVGGSYENYMGKDAQNSISIMQSSYQCLGHAFAKLKFEDSQEFRGISPFNRKVWSFQKGDIESFNKWCKTIVDTIDLEATVSFDLPNLPLKANLTQAESIVGEKILCFVLNSICYKDEITLKTIQDGENINVANLLEIDFKCQKRTNKEIEIKLFYEGTFLTSILYDLNEEDLCFVKNENSDDFYISSSKKNYRMEDFFNEFIPMIITSEGESLLGCLCFKVSSEEINLPIETVIHPINWNAAKVNIKKEIPFRGENENNKSIFTHITNLLIADADNQIVIKDDGSGEIADFIAVGSKSIKLFHCKASTEATAGLRVGEFYEVIGQAIRSNKWVRNSDIFVQLAKRISKNPARLIKGSLEDLNILKPHEFNYEIVVVQPGLDYVTLVNSSSNEVKKLIALGYDIIKASSDFSVICSE